MPLYDYKCTQCGKITEVRHGFNEVHEAPCPACGAPVARVFSAAPIVFKGSGFYLTDSRKKSAPEASSTSAPDASSTSAPAAADSSPAPAAESKPAAAKPAEPAA